MKKKDKRIVITEKELINALNNWNGELNGVFQNKLKNGKFIRIFYKYFLLSKGLMGKEIRIIYN